MERICEVINRDTVCALGSEKYIKRRTVQGVFLDGF